MRLRQLVIKDIVRRKRRVAYATLGVVIGTMTVVAILTIALAGQARIYNQLEKYGANLIVVPAVKSVTAGLGDINLGTLSVGETYISQDKIPTIRQITDSLIKEALKIDKPGDIATIAPELYVSSDIKGTSVVLVGIDPGPETNIKTWWKMRDGTYLQGTDEAMLGAVAASSLGLRVGDTILLKNISVTITGILEDTGSNEDYQIFVPLQTLQTEFGKEGLVSSINIRALCNACPVEIIADGINQDLSGVRAVAVKQVAATEMGMLERVNKLMLALAGVTLVVGAFGVVNTMLTSINERIKDIGIMRAVGASRNQIIRALIYEAVVIGVIGGLLGYLAGTGLAYVIGPLIFEGTMIAFVGLYLPLAIGLALLIAILATLYPAFRATRIKVADSFRSL